MGCRLALLLALLLGVAAEGLPAGGSEALPTGPGPGWGAPSTAAGFEGRRIASEDRESPEGARLFQRCFACHSLDPAVRNLSGPTLFELLGRRAGSVEGFDYSPAMREAGRRGLIWDAGTLDRFLEDPEDFLPGVRMGGVRLADSAQRRLLIRWLDGGGRRAGPNPSP
jgi:cytochrome c